MNSGSSTQIQDTLEAIGRRLRAARIERDWSAKEVALAASALFPERKPVSKKQVENIERGDWGQHREMHQVAMALNLRLGPIVEAAEEEAAQKAAKRTAG